MSWVAGAAAVHECATHAAEAVFHVVSCCDGSVLAKAGQFLFAADMLEVLVVDYEVGGEHAGGDLSAVGAVADERVDESGARGWHTNLDSAAVAGCCCLTVAVTVGAFRWENDFLGHCWVKVVFNGLQSVCCKFR